MKRKTKLYEDEPEAQSLTTGCHTQFTEIPKTDVRSKPQIGFIRQDERKKSTRTHNKRTGRRGKK
jgi:hypothetical protein